METDASFKNNNAQFFKFNGYNEVNGWLNLKILNSLDCCVDILNMHNHNWADTLEIGVHEGKFFIPLELVTPDEMIAYALDVFDMQYLNIDSSGHGNYKIFLENINKYCRCPERVKIIKNDSFSIRFTPLKNREFSLISIDGGHTVNHVMFDLEFAANTLKPGGIIFLDDFPNSSWLGVVEGATLFFSQMRHRIAPFAVGYNKMFITTTSHQLIYFKYFNEKMKNYNLNLVRKTKFAGWPILGLEKW